jgi:hypothetical protein
MSLYSKEKRRNYKLYHRMKFKKLKRSIHGNANNKFVTRFPITKIFQKLEIKIFA